MLTPKRRAAMGDLVTQISSLECGAGADGLALQPSPHDATEGSIEDIDRPPILIAPAPRWTHLLPPPGYGDGDDAARYPSFADATALAMPPPPPAQAPPRRI